MWLGLMDQGELGGMGEQRPSGSGDGVARLVLTARDDQLDVGADGGVIKPALHLNREGRLVG